MQLPIALIFLLFIPSVTAVIQINEVMYAPTNGVEWIELYNPTNQTVNLSGFEFEDSSSIDQIECCGFDNGCSLVVAPFSYAILTDQDTVLYEQNDIDTTKLCVDDNSLGNGLGNTQDSLRIFNDSFQTRYSYHKNDGGYLNNKTLERRSDNTWGQSLSNIGTPGRQNSIWELSAEFENIIITEIMPDPFGNANDAKPNGEWVELYNQGDTAIDLSGLILKDKDDENELYISHTTVLNEHPVIDAGGYMVVYRNGDSDFALNDNGYEEVRLFVEDTLLDSVSYSNTIEGMSIAKLDREWQISAPTPGLQNVYVPDCDWQISVDLNESMFKGDDLDFTLQIKRLIGDPMNVTVLGRIVDEFGSIVKEYKPATNKKITSVLTKSYSPNLKEGVYQLTFEFVNLSCNDLDTSNNNVHEILATNPRFKENQPTIEIEGINVGRDGKVEWGDQFDVKIHAYKGNSTRESLQVWVQEDRNEDGEKVSKISRASLKDEFKHYYLTLPVQLRPNCNEEVDEGTKSVIVSAFGLQATTSIEVEGVDKDVCDDYLDYFKTLEKANKNTGKLAYRILEIPTQIDMAEPLIIDVEIKNDAMSHDYTLWPYVYRGSKCYSCEENAQEKDYLAKRISLQSSEKRVISFSVPIDSSLEPGNYKLKVKIRKDEQKTTKDITQDITIVNTNNGSGSTESITIKETIDTLAADKKPLTSIEAQKKALLNKIPGVIIYESNATKASRLGVYFLLFSLILLCVVLVRQDHTKT